MDRDSRIRKILYDLADVAYTTADGVADAVQSASHVVGEKYDVLRLNVEISRLQGEQDKLFAGIGHTMYLLQSGEMPAKAEDGAEPIDAQQTIDRLLLLADQKQQEIDAAKDRLRELNGDGYCQSCGKDAEPGAVFCSLCGERLHG